MPNTHWGYYQSPQKPIRSDKGAETVVANVNKLKKLEKLRSSSKPVPKGKARAIKKPTVKPKNNKAAGKLAFAKRCKEITKEFTQQVGNCSTQPDRPVNNSGQEESAEFLEGNEILRMTVDQNDSLYEAEMDSDSSEEMDYEDEESDHSSSDDKTMVSQESHG